MIEDAALGAVRSVSPPPSLPVIVRGPSGGSRSSCDASRARCLQRSRARSLGGGARSPFESAPQMRRGRLCRGRGRSRPRVSSPLSVGESPCPSSLLGQLRRSHLDREEPQKACSAALRPARACNHTRANRPSRLEPNDTNDPQPLHTRTPSQRSPAVCCHSCWPRC